MHNFNRLAWFLLGTVIASPAFGQTIFPLGTVNAADYSRNFAPGAIISIFGTNLSTATATEAVSMPLPTSMNGTFVTLISTGQQLPLYYVSPGQINAGLPFNLATGQAGISVTTPAGVSNIDTISVSTYAPKFFTLNFTGTGTAVATTGANYQVLTASLPAAPGSIINLWLNSMGPTTGAPVAGEPAPGVTPGSQPLTLASQPTVTINGQSATVMFAGLAPGLSGLYQLDVQVPFDVVTGAATIQVAFANPFATVATQPNVTIPYRQLGFYYAILGGKPVAGQTLNGVSGATSALAFRQTDPISWGPTGYNAWTDVTGLSSIYSTVSGTAITLYNGTTVVYDNNGIETNSFGTFYNNTGGPADSQKPGLTDLYSMSNYFPLTYAGYFQLAQSTTVTELIGYFDPGGDPQLPFDPTNPFVKYRMNIFSMASGNLPKENGTFVGDVFSSDTATGTFSYSDTGVRMISSTAANVQKPIYRLVYKLSSPLTLPAGQYWFEHDASVRSAPAASSTSARSPITMMREDDFGALIKSQTVDPTSFRFNLFGREMFLGPSFVLPGAVEVHPSASVQAH